MHPPLTHISYLTILTLSLTHILALPASTPSSLLQSSTASNPVPGPKAVCDTSMGKLIPSDCTEAIALLPHDPVGRPVVRNFYTDPQDIDPTGPNQQLPFEKTHGACTAQLMLATNFNDVPHDEAPYINLIGPLRIILRDCVRDEGLGGVLVRNGLRQNIEVVLYNKDSIYGRITTLRNSPDPVAVSIAQQELLELLHLAPNVYDAPGFLIENQTASAIGVGSQPNVTASVDTA